jgi:hypothetical protein
LNSLKTFRHDAPRRCITLTNNDLQRAAVGGLRPPRSAAALMLVNSSQLQHIAVRDSKPDRSLFGAVRVLLNLYDRIIGRLAKLAHDLLPKFSTLFAAIPITLEKQGVLLS